jgi:hypothetical protein
MHHATKWKNGQTDFGRVERLDSACSFDLEVDNADQHADQLSSW